MPYDAASSLQREPKPCFRKACNPIRSVQRFRKNIIAKSIFLTLAIYDHLIQLNLRNFQKADLHGYPYVYFLSTLFKAAAVILPSS